MPDTNGDVLKLINANTKNPSFIIDESGTIISYNESAAKFIPPDFPLKNFFELFSEDVKIIISKLFTESIVLNKIISERIDIIFRNSGKLTCDIIFSSYTDERNKYSRCTFDNIEDNINGKVKFSVSVNEISEVINNKELLHIFDEIRLSFPFTLLGKNKLQHEINKIDELFWLKSTDGKYLLVNQKFSRQLGLKPSQVEGRFENEFLPSYLTELYESLNKFVSNSSNIMIKEGVSFPITVAEQYLQFIEFPICDFNNNVIAIIGISQKEKKKQDKDEIPDSILNQVDIPIIIVDENSKLKFSNEAAKKEITFLKEDELPAQVKAEIENFLRKPELRIQSIKLKSISNSDEECGVYVLKKLYNLQSEFAGTAIYPEIQSIEELNNLKIKGAMYEVLMQASPEPMFIYDIDNLRFLDVNKAASNLYGYNKKEFLQMDLTDLYAPEDIQTLLDNSDSRNAEGIYTGPWRHRKKDGTTILVQISKASFEFKNKKAQFNIIKDVTEKIGGQKEIQLFKSTFNSVSDMIFITDAEGFIQDANNAVTSLLGYTLNEIREMPFITLVSDVQRVDISNNIFYSNIKKSVSFECELKLSDGSLISTELSVSPVMDFENKITNYNIIIKANEAPQIEFSRQEKPKVQSEKSSGFDPSMLSSIFHEILTPMNVIIGFTQEIIDTIPEMNTEQKEAADIITQNKVMLVQIMDSVMEYSHIEQNRVKIKQEKFSFTEILDNLLEGTKKLAELNKIELAYGKISSSLSVENDKGRLEHLLIMLISIALRLTKEKKLYLSALPIDENRFIVSIKDNRKNISRHLLDNLQNIYSHQGLVEKEFGSSKLVLNLSKKLLSLLGGSIQTVEKTGEVIEFGFVFPLKYEGATEEIPEPVVEQKSFRKGKEKPVEVIPENKEKIVEEENKVQKSKVQEIEEIKEPEPIFSKIEIPPIIIKEAEPEIINEVVFEQPKSFEKEIVEPVVEMPTQILEAEIPVKNIPGKKKEIEFSELSCLYVEDQVDSQILFRVQMKELKKIDNAVSFESALPLLQQNKYDFIIMDINLQGEYNGLDALRIIRKLPGYEVSKIIAVTAYVLPGDKEKFISAGFNDFISKPLLKDKLTESIRKVIS